MFIFPLILVKILMYLYYLFSILCNGGKYLLQPNVKTIIIISGYNISSHLWTFERPQNNRIANILFKKFINYLDLKQLYSAVNSWDEFIDLKFSNLHIELVLTVISLVLIANVYHPPLDVLCVLRIFYPKVLNKILTPIINNNFKACNFRNN